MSCNINCDIIISFNVSFTYCKVFARLLKRLDFPDMKFSLYFLGYEVNVSTDLLKNKYLNITVCMNPLTLLVLYLVNAHRICLQPLLILFSGLDGLLDKRLPSSSLSMLSLFD
jgi:hypothetical protein